jgi:proteasomal ATPase-associated factor 1
MSCLQSGFRVERYGRDASVCSLCGAELKVSECTFQVILTSSSDTLLRIFSSTDGSNPRTLKGHKRAVTSTCILGIGRNILSSSKDGSIRLWDVSEGKCVTSMWSEGFTGIEKICIADRNVLCEMTQQEKKVLVGESVEDTQDKIVFAALSNGHFAVYDLASKSPIFGSIPHLPAETLGLPTTAKGGSIYAIAQSGTLLATGSSKGIIVIRDTKTLSANGGETLAVFRRTEGSINDLAFVSSKNHGLPDLVIATASGLACRVGFEERQGGLKVHVVEEYAGWEPVPIETVVVGQDGGVWFAGGEGGIKRY